MRYVKRSATTVLLIAAAAVCVWHFDLLQYVTLTNLRQFAQDHNVLGPLLLMAAYAAATVFFLPILPIAILAGIVYGLLWGSVYVVIGASTGAIVSFYIARRLGKRFVEKLTHKKFRKIHEYDDKIRKGGFAAVLAIRVIPFLPFKGPNYILGLTKVRTRDYVLGTVLGVIPESIIFVFLGDSFYTFSPWTIGWAAVIVVAVSALGWWGSVILKKRKRAKAAAEDSDLILP